MKLISCGESTRLKPCLWRALLCGRSKPAGPCVLKILSDQRSYATKAQPTRRQWSAQEIALLTKLKHQHASKDDILTRLPDRTWKSIAEKWLHMGDRDETNGRLLHVTGRRTLSSREMKMIFQYQEEGFSTRQIAARLSNVTSHQIQEFLTLNRSRPRCLERYPHKKWTTEEIQQLKDLRQDPLLKWSDIATALDRSIAAARTRYHQNKRGEAKECIRKYSKEEDETLIRMYNEGSRPSEIQRHLPGRSVASVKRRKMTIGHLIQHHPSQHTRTEQNRLAARVAAMRDSGKTWAEISQLLPDRTVRHMTNLLSRWRSEQREHEKQGLGHVEGETEREDAQP